MEGKILMQPRSFFESDVAQRAYDVGRRDALKEIMEFVDQTDNAQAVADSECAALRYVAVAARVERLLSIAERLAAPPQQEKADA
jgi:hypothetical protein